MTMKRLGIGELLFNPANLSFFKEKNEDRKI